MPGLIRRFLALYDPETPPDEDVRGAVATLEPATVTAVADRLGCDVETARKRLGALTAAGELTATTVDGEPVWRLPDGDP